MNHWSGLRLLRLWDHGIKRYRAAREIPHSLHQVERNSVLLPLRDGGGRAAEVRCESCGTPLLSLKPCVQIHDSSLGETKPVGQGRTKPPVFSIGLMTNPRRERFIAYFNGPPLNGSRAALMKKTGLTKGRLSQLFKENQPFGELAAKNLAEKLGLSSDHFEHDWGDSVPPPAVNELQRRMLVAFEEIPATERASIVQQLEKRANEIRELKKIIIREGYVPAPPAREGLLNPEPIPPTEEVKGRGRKK